MYRKNNISSRVLGACPHLGFLKLFWCMHVIITFVCIIARRRQPNSQNDVDLEALNAILHGNDEVVVPLRASNQISIRLI